MPAFRSQRSVLGYMEHWNYRELYSQSSDAMFIIDLDGNIQDCNGAALHLFKVRHTPLTYLSVRH